MGHNEPWKCLYIPCRMPQKRVATVDFGSRKAKHDLPKFDHTTVSHIPFLIDEVCLNYKFQGKEVLVTFISSHILRPSSKCCLIIPAMLRLHNVFIISSSAGIVTLLKHGVYWWANFNSTRWLFTRCVGGNVFTFKPSKQSRIFLFPVEITVKLTLYALIYYTFVFGDALSLHASTRYTRV